MASEEAIRKVLSRDMDWVEKREKTYGANGFMSRQIEGIGGDTGALADVQKSLEDLFRALEELEYAALAHLSTTESTEEDSVDHTNEMAHIMRLAGISDKE